MFYYLRLIILHFTVIYLLVNSTTCTLKIVLMIPHLFLQCVNIYECAGLSQIQGDLYILVIISNIITTSN